MGLFEALGISLVVTLTEEEPLEPQWFDDMQGNIRNLFVPVPNECPPSMSQVCVLQSVCQQFLRFHQHADDSTEMQSFWLDRILARSHFRHESRCVRAYKSRFLASMGHSLHCHESRQQNSSDHPGLGCKHDSALFEGETCHDTLWYILMGLRSREMRSETNGCIAS